MARTYESSPWDIGRRHSLATLLILHLSLPLHHACKQPKLHAYFWIFPNEMCVPVGYFLTSQALESLDSVTLIPIPHTLPMVLVFTTATIKYSTLQRYMASSKGVQRELRLITVCYFKLVAPIVSHRWQVSLGFSQKFKISHSTLAHSLGTANI